MCGLHTWVEFKGQAQATPPELLLEETLKMNAPEFCRAVGLEGRYQTRLLSPHQNSVSHQPCQLGRPPALKSSPRKSFLTNIFWCLRWARVEMKIRCVCALEKGSRQRLCRVKGHQALLNYGGHFCVLRKDLADSCEWSQDYTRGSRDPSLPTPRKPPQLLLPQESLRKEFSGGRGHRPYCIPSIL